MRTGQLKWDDLRVFLEVARQGSVHSAAKHLKLDHSTVCRRIGKLESQLSVKLLDRTHKGVVVRSEAKSLLKHVREMENHASSVEDVVTQDAADMRQIVRIATMEGIASCYLAQRISALERFAPNTQLDLVSIPQTVDLSRKEADIFLSFYNPKMRGLKSTLFGRFALHLYCSPAYQCRHGMPQTLADLQGHKFVGYIDDLLAIHAVRWLDEVVQSPVLAFRSNSILAQRSAALEGMGIVLLPTFVAAGFADLKRILVDQISVRREIWVSVRTEQSHLARIRAVSQFLKHIMNADADFLIGKASALKATS